MMPIIKNEKPDSDVEEVSVSPDKKKSKMQKGAHLLNSRSVSFGPKFLVFEFESDQSIFREVTRQSTRKEITIRLKIHPKSELPDPLYFGKIFGILVK